MCNPEPVSETENSSFHQAESLPYHSVRKYQLRVRRQKLVVERERSRGSASTQECLPGRHHANRPVAAGIHATARRSGAASALTSDPLPWRACPQREVALCERAGSTGEHKRTCSRSRVSFAVLTQTNLRRRFSSVFCPQSSVFRLTSTSNTARSVAHA